MQAVRDRFNLLLAQYQQKIKDEEKVTRISPESTPPDKAMENIVDRMQTAKKQLNQAEKENEKNKREKERAEEMRKKAMETFSKTKDRKKLDDLESPLAKQRRNSEPDMIQFLREKADYDRYLTAQELELQKEELRSRQDSQNNMFNTMVEQIKAA